MDKTIPLETTAANHQKMEDYDPNSMPVAKARAFIRNFLEPVAHTETVPLHACLGRVLATDILSPNNVPNYDNSAMDGYALHAADLDATSLKVVGTAFAGKAFSGALNRGECVRIMTGAAIPQGADTVVMQEKVRVNSDSIDLLESPKPHANLRYAGEDLRAGQVVLSKGHLIRGADLGLIASLGFAEVNTYRKLKVAIFSTGDELVKLGSPLQTGQVYDSNRYSLIGMLQRLGVELIDFGTIGDDPIMLEKTLLAASTQADVVITSGGVSVGEADFMKQLLVQHGQVLFWKIAMKPGRPLAYGKVGNAHYFGLPGNPVAVVVTFYQFVRDALITLMGAYPKPLPTFHVECTQAIKKAAGRTEFQRGILYEENGVWKVKPTGAQGSSILSSMSQANCFIVLDEATSHLNEGSMVCVQVLDGII